MQILRRQFSDLLVGKNLDTIVWLTVFMLFEILDLLVVTGLHRKELEDDDLV